MSVNRNIEREVTFQVQVRPLRLAYIVRHAADLEGAVAFYTHLWGGAANGIIPLPQEGKAEVEEQFFDAIESFNPDYIFLPHEMYQHRASDSIPAVIQELQRRSSARLEKFDPSHVRSFATVSGWLGCGISTRGGGRLGYLMPNTLMLSNLHPQGLKPENSRLVLPRMDGPFGFFLRLKSGAPCAEISDYLLNSLGATPLRSPNSCAELIQIQIVCYKRITPAGTTTAKCRTSITNASKAEHSIFLDDDVLGIFLCENEHDTATACCFWNARGSSLADALILPRTEFEADLEAHVKLICEAFSVLRGVYVVTPGDSTLLAYWHQSLKAAFAARGRDVAVYAMASGYQFPPGVPNLRWGNPITLSRAVRSDNSVIFSPPVPPAHDRRDGGYAFACDVEVTLAGGRKLNLPPTNTSAVLLSRDLEEIEYAERGEIAAAYYRESASVRPRWRGLSLVATADSEATFFLPPDNDVVTRHLADKGYAVRPNRQTRYAQGIVNLLGGYVGASRFFLNEGLEVPANPLRSKSSSVRTGIPSNRWICQSFQT